MILCLFFRDNRPGFRIQPSLGYFIFDFGIGLRKRLHQKIYLHCKNTWVKYLVLPPAPKNEFTNIKGSQKRKKEKKKADEKNQKT